MHQIISYYYYFGHVAVCVSRRPERHQCVMSRKLHQLVNMFTRLGHSYLLMCQQHVLVNLFRSIDLPARNQ